MTIENPQKTPLFDRHTLLNAEIIDFNGWALPLKYTSIINEHNHVRQHVGLFDISHMGRFVISGEDVQSFLQRLITNNIKKITDSQILYTLLCNHKGGIIDDVLIMRKTSSEFILVGNASNITKDFSWLNENKGKNALSITNITQETGMLAIQGPAASLTLQSLCDKDLLGLDYFHFIETKIDEHPLLLSRTGYTGEDGFELIIALKDCEAIWDILMQSGQQFSIKPIGLGARDTLRLEMKYPLYGSDIDEATSPLEADLAWTVSFNKGDFIGRNAIIDQREKGITKKLIGFEMLENAIPRHGYPILRDEKEIGTVCSGTFSPSLKKGIGTAYVHMRYAHISVPIQITIHGTSKLAEVTRTPFYKCGSLHRNHKKNSE
ncbi:glycine cleavage system aminomethyltransferase GcvT [Chlamydiota bacterium]